LASGIRIDPIPLKALMTDVTDNASATAVPRKTAPLDDLLFAAHRSGHFKHLMAAIKAAGLTDMFNGEGPYTVFAPNDKAFDRLARNVLADLLKPESRARLVALLKLHVVPGRVWAVTSGDEPVVLTSLQGGALTLDTSQGLRVNRARIVVRDIEASNGLIHEIDTVLMPDAG